MKILLLNLTRFGDLLQSQAAVTDLARLGHDVGLVCLANFTGAARLLSGLSHVACLPGARLLQMLSAAPQAGPGWREAAADLAAWRDELLRAFSPDMVCNLTPNPPARLLARYIAGSRPCTGFALDSSGFGVNSSSWAAFFQGASAHRGVSPFNVVDLFRKVALADLEDAAGRAASSGVPPDPEAGGGEGESAAMPPGDASLRRPDAETLSWAETLLQRAFVALPGKPCASPPNGFAALQLGASEDRRRWPVAYFAELGRRLWEEEGVCPVLLGSGAETPLAEKYGELAAHPYISLCGKTDLEQLAAALCHMRLLVTNDTGTMHLAVGLGVPVLAAFLATAQPFDTGPYREGSCSVEPDLPCHPCAFGSACACGHACRHAVRPGVMAGLALSRLRGGVWNLPEPQAPDTAAEAGARVWVSECDDTGFMGLRSLSGHGDEDRTRWLSLQRRLLRPFLDRARSGVFRPGPPAGPWGLEPDTAAELLRDISAAAAFIALMLQQGKILLARDIPMMRQKFLSTWQKAQVALDKNPRLRALETLWVEETQAEGQDLPLILRVAEQFLSLLRAFENEISL